MIENEEIIKLLIEGLEQQKIVNSELIALNKEHLERISAIEERLKKVER